MGREFRRARVSPAAVPPSFPRFPPAVMPGLVPGIHVGPPARLSPLTARCRKTWMPGTSPGMTTKGRCRRTPAPPRFRPRRTRLMFHVKQRSALLTYVSRETLVRYGTIFRVPRGRGGFPVQAVRGVRGRRISSPRQRVGGDCCGTGSENRREHPAAAAGPPDCQLWLTPPAPSPRVTQAARRSRVRTPRSRRAGRRSTGRRRR